MSSRWTAIAAAAAPVLLLVVASAQFAFSRFATLSPWKGGGFGMFSTVDSPAARFLRIHLITPSREIAVPVPDSLRDLAFDLRTTGSRALAEDLARDLVEGTWVELRLTSAVEYYRYLLRKGPPPGLDREVAAELERPSASADAVVDFKELDFARMLKPRERPEPGDAVLDVAAVRVEVWKYAFDRDGPTLNATRIARASASLSGSRPES